MPQNVPDRYFVIYKPIGMISQFVSPYEHTLLGDLDFSFPPKTHAVGRLDEPSEGLLILTTDKTLTRKLLHPTRGHRRVYFVLVARVVSPGNLENLRRGVDIKLKQKGVYRTEPCDVMIIGKDHKDFDRLPQAAEPWETWLRFELTEGKNRQIRKMCWAEKLRCKRLLRVSINDLHINSMRPGEVIEMEKSDLFGKLWID